MVYGSLVKTLGTVEGTNSTDHDVGTFIIAVSVVENFTSRASSACSVASEAALAVIGTILAGSVDGVGSDGASIQTFEVEEVSAARLT